MTLDYTTPGVLQVDITEYVKSMVEDFPKKVQRRNVGPLEPIQG